jgi:hypothetical protein
VNGGLFGTAAVVSGYRSEIGVQSTMHFALCQTSLIAVVLIGAITLGCRQTDNSPPLPAPPDLTRRDIPKPPGMDDYAHRRFATPLSLQDAEAILRQTQIFAFGDMPPKRQVQAFNVLLEQRDAVSRFQRLAESASPAGKLYALAGLLLLDRPAAAKVQQTLARESQVILVFDSDVALRKPVSELAAMVVRRKMGTAFRRVRDETNAYYAKKQ